LTLTLELWLYLAFATSFVVSLCWIAVVGDFFEAIPPSSRPQALRKLRVVAALGLLHPLLGLVAWDACRTYTDRSGVSARSADVVAVMRLAAATSTASSIAAGAFSVLAAT
jgi:hypothetical protein